MDEEVVGSKAKCNLATYECIYTRKKKGGGHKLSGTGLILPHLVMP
jgi:hypothetical protein